MKNFFKKLIEMLFLFHKFSFQTKLSKDEISKRVGLFISGNSTDYYGWVKENGFYVAKRAFKSLIILHIANSFATVAWAKITVEEETTTVSVLLSMNIIVWIIALLMVFAILISQIVWYPVFLLIMYFAFFRPAKRLKEKLESLLTEN